MILQYFEVFSICYDLNSKVYRDYCTESYYFFSERYIYFVKVIYKDQRLAPIYFSKILNWSYVCNNLVCTIS